MASCSKEDASLKTAASVVEPPTTVTTRAATSADFATTWNEFVERVSRGEFSDPLGQYVSKKAYVENDGFKERPTRPKYTQEERDEKLGELGITKNEPGETANKSYSYQFASSDINLPPPGNVFPPGSIAAALNPNGYIWDLKIVKGGRSPMPGYTIIPIDLNRGAGGQYIYLSFIRDPQREQLVPDEGDNPPRGPVRGLTSQSQRIGAVFTDWPEGYAPTWADWTNISETFLYKEGDLNDGAGGRFVYGYQSKLESKGQPIEVGVLSGNGNVQPPGGWVKVGGDLNEEAGGAYVWFCIRRRL